MPLLQWLPLPSTFTPLEQKQASTTRN